METKYVGLLIIFFISIILATIVVDYTHDNAVLTENTYYDNVETFLYLDSAQTLEQAPVSSTVTVKNQTWLDFDGVDDGIDMGVLPISRSDSSTDVITIAFWLNTNENITNRRIIGTENTVNFLWNNGKMRVRVENSTNIETLNSVTSPTIGIWEHWGMRFSGDQARLFYNGKSDSSGGVGDVTGINPVDEAFEIGKILTSHNNGSIDEIYVINESFTNQQMERLYNSSSRALGQSVAVLNYHQVEDAEYPDTVVNISEFTEQMQYLSDNNYTTITYKDFENFRDGTYVLPDKPVILSFDDGNRNIYTNATPIMDSFGFVGVMAIITDQMDVHPSTMNWSEAIELKNKGWELASHSINSSALTGMTTEQRDTAYQNSKSAIEGNVTGYTVTSFIFPGGNRNSTLDDECSIYYNVCGGYANSDTVPQYNYERSSLTHTIQRITIDNETVISDFSKAVGYKDNIISHIRLNENSGTTAYDSSGNSTNGTITGATWNNDGVDNTLTNNVDYSTSSNQFTILNSEHEYQEINTDYRYAVLTAGSSGTMIRLTGVLFVLAVLSIIGYFIGRKFEFI